MYLPADPRGPAAKVVASLAAVGSLLVVLVMVVPASPAALKWPLEWAILAAFCLCGIAFWATGRRHRSTITESERARLILSDQ